MIHVKKKLFFTFLMIILIASGVGLILFLNFSKVNDEYDVQIAFPDLSFSRPLGIYDAGDGTNRLFVVEQDGLIKVFQNNVSTSEYQVFLDLTTEISINENERGLLGLTFHPDYSINGYFYVYYTEVGTGDSVISRFKVNSTDINRSNKSSEVYILQISQPYGNHNGGQINFGPDGYLYISLGDGGGSGDPAGHGQNRATLLGSILRIDVDSTFPYAIPNDNPFFGNLYGWAEEIFAFGLRNPWRFNFDTVTGLLWAGDVGENVWEEIDLIENGKNYGWNAKEGSHSYNSGINVTELEDPVFEYNHLEGVSITGGYVYRGSSLTNLIGKYIYADYGSGKIWSLEYVGGIVKDNTELIDTNLNIPSFGVDSNNELYICAFDGKIYTLIEV